MSLRRIVALVPPEEEEAFLHIICQSFDMDLPTALPYFYDDPYYSHNQRWGLWVEESGRRRLVSVLTAAPADVDWRACRAVYGDCGGRYHPAYRRRGYATHLLRQVAETLREQAVPVAVLQAFDHNFYRRLGWGDGGHAGAPARLSRADCLPIPSRVCDAPSSLIMRRSLRSIGNWRPAKRACWCATTCAGTICYGTSATSGLSEHAGADRRLSHSRLSGGGLGASSGTRVFVAHGAARRALLGWLARNGDHVRQIEFAGTLSELQALGIIP